MRLSRKAPAPSTTAGVNLFLPLLVLLSPALITAQQPAQIPLTPKLNHVLSIDFTKSSTPVILRAFDEDARRTSTSKAPTTLSPEPQPDLFLPLTPGTWWLYRGTVQWFDPETQKAVTTEVSLTTRVEKVIEKADLTLAIITGFPSDLDWSAGEVEPKPFLLVETRRHEVFLDPVPPDFDYARLEKDTTPLDKFLAKDNLFFRWPLKKGMKFGDPAQFEREDNEYCWFVNEELTRDLTDIKGLSTQRATVFVLRFVTDPDDTEIELSPGIGILSYQYHHHGTVADTSLTLVEFHPVMTLPMRSGAKP
jgi:hypothetical protein